MPGADRATQKKPGRPSSLTSRHAPRRAGVEMRFQNWPRPSRSTTRCAAPYRPCTRPANVLRNEAAGRRPVGSICGPLACPLPPHMGAVGRGVRGRCLEVMELHRCHPVKGGMIAAFRVRPRLQSSQAAWTLASDKGSRRRGPPTARWADAASRADFHRSFRGTQRRCSVVEMLETSDGEQRCCHRPTNLLCDRIFAHFKVHITHAAAAFLRTCSSPLFWWGADRARSPPSTA